MSSFIVIIEVGHADGEYHPPIVLTTQRIDRMPIDAIVEAVANRAIKDISEAGDPYPTKVTVLLERHRCDIKVAANEPLVEVIGEAIVAVELSEQELLQVTFNHQTEARQNER